MAEVKPEEAATPFTLKNVGSGFEGRIDDVFSGLDALEQQHFTLQQSKTDTEDYDNLKSDDDDDDDDDGVVGVSTSSRSRSLQQQKGDYAQEGRHDLSSSGQYQHERAEAEKYSSPRKDSDRGSLSRDRNKDSFRGKGTHWHSEETQSQRPDTQFRRPRGRAPHAQSRVPDHRKRPQNWTYYSLEDVTGADMSEKSNTQAALAFLDERRKLHEQGDDEDHAMEAKEVFDAGSGACSKGLFSFSKRSKTSSLDCKTSGKDKAVAEGVERVVQGDGTVVETSSEQGQDEVSNKLTITSMDDEVSGKSAITCIEGEASGKSTITSFEDKAAGKSTITSIEVEASGKSTITSLELEEDITAETKPTFKSRKGIRRNIRSRDDDE